MFILLCTAKIKSGQSGEKSGRLVTLGDTGYQKVCEVIRGNRKVEEHCSRCNECITSGGTQVATFVLELGVFLSFSTRKCKYFSVS
jgi:hypothetical protein